MAEVIFDDYPFLSEIGLEKVNHGCYHGEWTGNGAELPCINPHNGKTVSFVKESTLEDLETCISKAESAKQVWMNTPIPARGELVRQIGEALQQKADLLGRVISLVMGKTLVEATGEIYEIITVCNMALGLSRQLEGKIFPSERSKHVLLEVWNPLGVIGVISAFNYPAGVYGWNLAIGLVTGNCLVWKGAPTTSLVSVALIKVISEVITRNGYPDGIITLVNGGVPIGESLISDKRVKLVSFTGSTAVGRHVSQVVHNRFGRLILELGGNSAAIVTEDADFESALRACVLDALYTNAERCTTLRRLLVQEPIYEKFKNRVLAAYATIKIGDPLNPENFFGPLHTAAAVKQFVDSIEKIKEQGGKILYGGQTIEGPGFYVQPTVVEIEHSAPIVQHELFLPILYLIKFSTLDEAIAINNEVSQGLSSALFSLNMRHMWQWLGPNGSDCGLANVNLSTSGEEMGGAFGGEKETGEGRESGSDSWKHYMRRTTCAVNYSTTLSLAQGVTFNIS